MVFLLSSSQWRTRRALALMPKSMRQGLSKIIWDTVPPSFPFQADLENRTDQVPPPWGRGGGQDAFFHLQHHPDLCFSSLDRKGWETKGGRWPRGRSKEGPLCWVLLWGPSSGVGGSPPATGSATFRLRLTQGPPPSSLAQLTTAAPAGAVD